MRLTNAWLMFSECMSTSNLHMHNGFRLMCDTYLSDCMANVRRAFEKKLSISTTDLFVYNKITCN